jgi:predicted unusual protein kinase regulating ubiquinone biosynthesis (AarF/ABC1/UbiB family)
MVHQIVTQDLNIRNVCAKIITKNHNDDQKVCQNKVSAEMFQELENELDFLTQVKMGDET